MLVFDLLLAPICIVRKGVCKWTHRESLGVLLRQVSVSLPALTSTGKGIQVRRW